MLIRVDHRHHIGADRRGRQINDDLAILFAECRVVFVGAGRCGVEDENDVFPFRHFRQPVETFMRGRHAHLGGARETV